MGASFDSIKELVKGNHPLLDVRTYILQIFFDEFHVSLEQVKTIGKDRLNVLLNNKSAVKKLLEGGISFD